jgi:hypothetical protein
MILSEQLTRGDLIEAIAGDGPTGASRCVAAAALYRPDLIAKHLRVIRAGAIADPLLRDVARSALADLRSGMRPAAWLAWARVREHHSGMAIALERATLRRLADLMDDRVIARAVAALGQGVRHAA